MVKFQTKVNVPFVVRVCTFIYLMPLPTYLHVLTASLSPIPHSRRRTRPASVTLPKPTYPGTAYKNIEIVLVGIKIAFQRPEVRKLQQPPDGQVY